MILVVVEHDQTDEGRIFGGKKAAEGNNVFVFLVTAARSGFLGGTGFAGDGETGNGRLRGRAALAHDTAQGEGDLRRGLGRDHLPNDSRFQDAGCFALVVDDRFDDAGLDQLAAVRHRRHRH